MLKFKSPVYMLRRAIYIVTFLLLMIGNRSLAQCPVNMGFDMGTFQGWEGYTGTIHDPDGTITLNNQGIVNGIHTIIARKSKQTDPYAHFPVASPNGSNYVAMLGNDSRGGGQNKAQKLTYTFTVPQNNNNFSLIYYYAVVIEDPVDARHTDLNKPKFAAAVYNLSDNKPTDCANFDFVSIGTLPGFGAATTQTSNNDVYFKPWSPVTIDLRGYAGKTMRLEFTTNNCGPGGHFAYAYIDVNQNCTSPLSGNIICSGNNTMTLKAPSGFKAYAWYNGRNFTQVIGTDSTYKLSPLPPVGTQYSVVVTPYDGLGCQDTLTTTIQSSENLILNVKSSIAVCRNVGADITTPDITSGSDTAFVYTYYKDAACTTLIDDPTNITDVGTYYIKATPPSECFFVKPIRVSFLPTPVLKITSPPEVCEPLTVDITKAYVTAGSALIGNSPLTYYTDAAASQPLSNPDKIGKSGTYYIKAINTANGCADIEPVTVLINNLPIIKTSNIVACETADITSPAANAGNENIARYTYWLNAQCTDTLKHPEAITTTGRYYIRAYSAAGCYVSTAIDVAVYPYPVTTVTDPPAVIFPQTIDITHAFTTQVGTQFAFYIDSLATRLLPDPSKISVRGTYYIQAYNLNNCAKIFPVHVKILPPVIVDYGINTFTPNGDGNNDVFRLKITKAVRLNHFRVYNSWGALLFETTDYLKGWDGASNGKKMPVGTYYWIMDAYDLYLNKPIQQSGSVTIVL
ncbi:MAG: gliding motility-associated C-terminal domain-containing protein [Mucilaginibacter sp.]|uniref:gliding motility-associated C-terminal domain-containing protein n=1 Tax=Mucilaginibacter sp. TaxID=1882438 RepID=UPI00326782A2